jgi:hypothetical protein
MTDSEMHETSSLYITYDDLLIVPQLSDITSVADIDLSSDLLGVHLDIPVIVACGNPGLATFVHAKGGLGILDEGSGLTESTTPLFITVRASDPKESLSVIKNAAAEFPLIGVRIVSPNGHSRSVATLCEAIKGHALDPIANLKVIACQVFTTAGAVFLKEAGVDAIESGIPLYPGVGVPPASALIECLAIKGEFPDFPIIAPIESWKVQNVYKALALGANAVSLSSFSTSSNIFGSLDASLREMMIRVGTPSLSDLRNRAELIQITAASAQELLGG